jgi:hypothetical protein
MEKIIVTDTCPNCDSEIIFKVARPKPSEQKTPDQIHVTSRITKAGKRLIQLFTAQTAKQMKSSQKAAEKAVEAGMTAEGISLPSPLPIIGNDEGQTPPVFMDKELAKPLQENANGT